MKNTSSPTISPVSTSTALGTVQSAGPGTSLGINVLDSVTKSDLVAIVRSETEDRLSAEQAIANRELSKLNAKLADLNAALDKIALEVVADVDLEGAESAAKILNATFGLKATAGATLESRDDDRRRFSILIATSKPASYGDRFEVIASKTVTVSYSPAATDILKEIKSLQRSIKDVQGRLINIKGEVSNLPLLERRAHAELARTVLARTAEGRQLLSSMRGVKSVTVDVQELAAA